MPPATEMNQLVWDDGLENIAQSYVETCPGFAHNNDAGVNYLAERDAGNTRWGPDTEYLNNFCNGEDCIPVGENLLGFSGTLTVTNIVSFMESLWWNEYSKCRQS